MAESIVHKHNTQGERIPGRTFIKNGKRWRVIKVYCSCGKYVKNDVVEEKWT